MKKHFLPLFLIIIVTYWTVKPLLRPGYFSMHDDTQVARVIVMGRALRNGQFPVRWVSGLGYGYGYPLYNFYGPLPYYVGGGLYAAGVSAVVATKIMMGVGMVLSAIFMYALMQFLFGRLTGILAAVLFAYAPYHAVQLYVRGAVGELWAYAFLPVLFLGLFFLSDSKKRQAGIWVGGLGLAGVILSHTISGYVAVAFYVIGLAIYTLILLLRKKFHPSFVPSSSFKAGIHHVSLLAVALGVSAFFWLPAIVEMGYTNVAGQIGATANFRDHFVCVPQLWNSLWGYGGSVSGCIDGMSFKAGKLHIMLGVLGLGLGILRLKRGFWSSPLGLVSIVGLGGAVMVTSYSRGVWELMPRLAFVQYPWRFLSGIALMTAIVGGSVLFWISRRWVRAGAFVLISLAVILLNAKLFVPQEVYEKPASFFENEEELSWRVSGVSDEYLPPSFSKPTSVAGIVHETLVSDNNRGLIVEVEIDTETYVKLHVQVPTSIEVILNRAYFPGWQYWVNGKRQIARIDKGLPSVIIPVGRSVVELRFESTLVRVIGTISSIGVILWFLITYGKKSIA
ncbi:MAG: 6-pyruvoyl-tetrahydropterin synthase-related protein [Patescibacteria group bacterium]